MKPIEIVFLLKFNYQIKRTRPETHDQLLRSFASFAKDAGVRIKRERRFISVSFNEDEMCVSLDIMLFIEQIKKIFIEIERDTYGWNIVITKNSSDINLDELFRSFPIGGEFFFGSEGSVWCSKDIVDIFTDLFDLGAPLSFAGDSPFIAAKGFRPVLCIKENKKKPPRFSTLRKITQLLEEKDFENTLLTAPPFSGKGSSLEEFAYNIQNDFPPLFISFDASSAGLGCFSIAFNTEIKNIFKTVKIPQKKIEQLERFASIIDKDFLRSECSLYLEDFSFRLFNLLFSNYVYAAKHLNKKPIIILLNIEKAAPEAEKIFFSVYNEYSNKKGITFYGTTSAKKISQKWLSVFKQVFAIQNTEEALRKNDIPPILNDVLYEASYALSLFIKYFPPKKCKELFESAGKSVNFINYIFSNLAEYGIIKESSCAKILYKNIEKIAEAKIGERGNFIRAIVGKHLVKWVVSEKLKASFDFIEALFALGCKIEDRVLLDAVLCDVHDGTFRKIERSVKDGSFLEICGVERGRALISIFKALKALLYGSEKETHSVFSKIHLDTSGAEDFSYKAIEYALDALYRFGVNDNAQALKDAKKSLALSQNNNKNETLSRVYRIMALISLSAADVSEAQDYIKFAKNISQHNSKTNEKILNSYYAGAIYFILGNISQSMREAEAVKKEALNSGRMDWFTKGEFLYAKFLFEIGDYKGAQNILKEMLRRLKNNNNGLQYKIIYAWHYRCAVYLRNIPLENITKENIFLKCDDIDFFKIEALYFSGNYSETVKKADIFLQTIKNPSFQFIERPEWTSGFSGMELLVFKKQDFFSRLAEIYRALSICNYGNHAEKIEAVESIQDSLRKNPPSALNPASHFIYYAYYCMLESVARNEIDRNTAISMAFKHLQNRASKIDDINIKRSFLNAPYWNKLLSAAAIKHKLV